MAHNLRDSECCLNCSKYGDLQSYYCEIQGDFIPPSSVCDKFRVIKDYEEIIRRVNEVK